MFSSRKVKSIILNRMKKYFFRFPQSYFLTNPLKISHFYERFKQLRENGYTFPIMARIDLTLACNHKCFFCMYRSSETLAKASAKSIEDFFSYKKINIDKKKLIFILEKMKKYGLKSVMFTGGGEPLLHPHFKDILNKVITCGLKVGLITNGSLLTESHFRLFNKKGFEWIRISLDAATKLTWKKIHRPIFGLDFDEIISLISKYAGKKRKYHIGINFVMVKDNIKEVLSAVDLSASLGVDSIRITPAYLKDTSFLEKINLERLTSKLKEKERLYKNLNITFNYGRVESRLKFSRTPLCFLSFSSISIGVDLRIYPCCMYKYDKKHILLDLNKEKINYELSKKLVFKSLKYPLKNYICNHCMFYKFNESCSYLLLEEPPFYSFIS